jgi:hypothetical protein
MNMFLFALTLIMLASCQTLRIKPDSEKGKSKWRLDTCIVDNAIPICAFKQGQDSYTYRNDTCFLHKAEGFTAIYIKHKPQPRR